MKLLLTPKEQDTLRKNWLKTKLQCYDVIIERTAKAQLTKARQYYETEFQEILDGAIHSTIQLDEQLCEHRVEVAKRQEGERIKKSINDYYAKPDVEQGIIGFTQAVRQALEEKKCTQS